MRKYVPLLFKLFVVVILSSCSFSKKTLSNGDKWIPTEFNPKKTVLLVEQWSGRGKGELKQDSYMAEKYPDKYEIVPLSTIKDRKGKYADTKIYKWALVSSSISRAATGTSTNSGVIRTVEWDFSFYDRENDKKYRSTNKSQGPFKQTFQVVINTIVKHIGA